MPANFAVFFFNIGWDCGRLQRRRQPERRVRDNFRRTDDAFLKRDSNSTTGNRPLPSGGAKLETLVWRAIAVFDIIILSFIVIIYVISSSGLQLVLCTSTNIYLNSYIFFFYRRKIRRRPEEDSDGATRPVLNRRRAGRQTRGRSLDKSIAVARGAQGESPQTQRRATPLPPPGPLTAIGGRGARGQPKGPRVGRRGVGR